MTGNKGGRPRLLDAAAQGRFLDSVRRGERLEEAAAASGFALSSFYHRRRRDAEFDSDWQGAMEEAAGPVFVPARRPGGKPRLGRRRRRPRFSAGRRARYLAALGETCNTSESAESADVHRSAVYRCIARDAGFARDNEAALAAGYARLDRRLVEEREARAARALEPPRGIVAIGEPTGDFELAMKLMARWERPAPRRRDRWRRRPMSLDEMVDSLEVKLSRMDIPPC